MPTETELRQFRCCFTGHRPEKMFRAECDIKKDLEREIKQSIDSGFKVFISGMARGTDLWAAEIVLKQKRNNQDIKLICAIPYIGFEKSWSIKTQTQYHHILDHADFIKVLDQSYSLRVFQIRNEWMVNYSSKVIAVFNGKAGGTKNTIDYAARLGIPISIITG